MREGSSLELRDLGGLAFWKSLLKAWGLRRALLGNMVS
jgi:hypothetical protein